VRTIEIPSDKVAAVQSPECESWLIEHCPHSVQGRVLEGGTFAIDFEDDEEAEAFRRRWLA
jgi:hypothetical protein